MHISSVLAHKGSAIATVRSDATVSHAVGVMSRLNIGALVVSDDGRRIEGIVSERDVVRRMHVLAASPLHDSVALIMSTDVPTCAPDDSTEQVMGTMTNRRTRHVPVVQGGELLRDREYWRRRQGQNPRARASRQGAGGLHHGPLMRCDPNQRGLHQGASWLPSASSDPQGDVGIRSLLRERGLSPTDSLRTGRGS